MTNKDMPFLLHISELLFEVYMGKKNILRWNYTTGIDGVNKFSMEIYET